MSVNPIQEKTIRFLMCVSLVYYIYYICIYIYILLYILYII